MKLILLLSLLFFSSLTTLSQNFYLHTNKLVVCDVNETPKFENSSCHVLIKITNDTLVLTNEKNSVNRTYLFSNLVEKTDKSTSWTCKNNTETGVILFFLQKVNKEEYIFYIFFENVTYRYYCTTV